MLANYRKHSFERFANMPGKKMVIEHLFFNQDKAIAVNSRRNKAEILPELRSGGTRHPCLDLGLSTNHIGVLLN